MKTHTATITILGTEEDAEGVISEIENALQDASDGGHIGDVSWSIDDLKEVP